MSRLANNSENTNPDIQTSTLSNLQNDVLNSTQIMNADPTNATTHFTSDDMAVVNDLTSVTYTSDGLEVKLMSIRDFLSKPYLVSQGSWTTSQPQATLLTSASIAATLTGTTYWANKIQGFGLIRATAVIRVVLNANPFQNGRLLLHFLPCVSHMSANFETIHNVNLAAMTQHPNVEMDCRSTMVELKIPYRSPVDYYDIKSGLYDWGKYYLNVLSPLNTGSGGEQTADYSVYLYFEDVELAAPTVPQSSSGPRANRRMVNRRAVNDSEKEAQAMSGGTISKALGAASKVADILSDIPVISKIAGTASWALDAASGLASYFGYAKPLSEEQSTVISTSYNRYAAVADGGDYSAPLGLIARNKVDVLPFISTTEQDEMSLSFLKKVPALIATIDWNDTDVSGTSLFSKQMLPNGMYQGGTKNVGGHTAFYGVGPPIYYLSNSFALWRGSFEVVLKIVKTQYHSGRLQITFTPGSSVVNAPTTSTGILALREVIDIRDGDEIHLNIPWLINSKYLDGSDYSGQLDITVLNELRHPETAASDVQILMYVNGGDDFEFAVPANPGLLNAVPFSPQSGLLVDGGIGNTSVSKLDTVPAQLCVGEQFASVKQFLARYSRALNKGPQGLSSNSFSVWPWFCGLSYMTSGTGVLNGGDYGGDLYSFIAPGFAFMRGSARVMTFDGNMIGCGSVSANVAALDYNGGYIVDLGVPLVTGNYASNNPYYLTANTSNSVGFVINDVGVGPNAVTVPYYSATHSSLVLNQTDDFHLPSDFSQPRSVVAQTFVTSSSVTNFALFRSFGDDFQLGYFIGFPPLLRNWV